MSSKFCVPVISSKKKKKKKKKNNPQTQKKKKSSSSSRERNITNLMQNYVFQKKNLVILILQPHSHVLLFPFFETCLQMIFLERDRVSLSCKNDLIEKSIKKSNNIFIMFQFHFFIYSH